MCRADEFGEVRAFVDDFGIPVAPAIGGSAGVGLVYERSLIDDVIIMG